VSQMGKTDAVKICRADLDATVFREWHNCSEYTFHVDADFGLIATKMYEMAEKLSFVTVALFDGLTGSKKVGFPH
jgi:hypothetical protein